MLNCYTINPGWLQAAVSLLGALASWIAVIVTIVLRRRERLLEMRRSYTDLFESRETFWSIIRDAYSDFRALKPTAPQNLDDLIGTVGKPPDLYPRKGRDLRLWLIENVPTLNADQRLMWEFVSQIYPPYQKQGKVTDHSLIQKERAEAFHKARGALAHFWQDWIPAVGIRTVEKSYTSEKNQVVLLSWLEIALLQWTQVSGEGKNSLFAFVHKIQSKTL